MPRNALMKIILSTLYVLFFSLNAVSVDNNEASITQPTKKASLNLKAFNEALALFSKIGPLDITEQGLTKEEDVSKFILSIFNLREEIRNQIKKPKIKPKKVQFFTDNIRSRITRDADENASMSLLADLFLRDALDPIIKNIFAQIAELPTGSKVFFSMQKKLYDFPCEQMYLLDNAIKICELNRDKPIMLSAMRAFEKEFPKLTEDIKTVSEIRDHYRLIDYINWCFRDIFRWHYWGGAKFNSDQLSHLCDIIIIQINFYYFHECRTSAEQVIDVHQKLLQNHSKLSNPNKVKPIKEGT